MANTRTSAKRAKQAIKKQTRNTIAKSKAKSVLKDAFEAIRSKNVQKAKDAYALAVKELAKAGGRGTIPFGRASRKISRLTLLAKKTLPEILPFLSK